jgi:hypothetical protein
MKNIRFLRTSILFALTVMTITLRAEEFAPLFPFSISPDAPDNIVNISAWNDVPAGRHGFIRVENGQFVHDNGRFLIWGTNTAFSANFPDKTQAEKLAARLSRFGFNCVRLHHMDSRDIWGQNAKSQLTLNPEQLDKLDYYIYQLKQHGIYVNINLHVSRWMDNRDDFSDQENRPLYDKGLDNFYPPLIELQKKYARDLLTHVNPYTKTAYFEEPAVAMIEINNENSVVSQWAGGKSTKIMDMPEPYRTEFRKQWNHFLKRKYQTTGAVAEAWKSFSKPLGNEMFTAKMETQKWYAEIDRETKIRKIQNGNIFRFEVEKMGNVDWHPQLIAGGLKIEAGKPYTFSIRARSEKPHELSLGLHMAENPWENLGFRTTISLTEEWKNVTISFIPSKSCEKARFDIAAFKPGVFEFTEASLKPGGTFGLKPDQTLENETIPIVTKNDQTEAVNDFCEFLFDIEEKYWVGMYRFLKDELHVRQPVCGTQIYYGSATIQAKLDYVDVHAYWNHPQFPGRAWDPNHWTINNRALVNDADKEIFPHLATARVNGKPYTVSELDSPFPNQYAAELLPMVAAFGRFQNWDGIFHFAYAHSNTVIDAQKTTSFFDMVGNTVKLAHQPACVAMFRRGDVAEGKTLLLGGFDAKTELNLFKKDRSPWNFNFKGIGLEPGVSLIYRTALDLAGKTSDNFPLTDTDDVTDFCIAESETKQFQLAFNPKTRQGGSFAVDTPNTKLITGFYDSLEGEGNLGDISFLHLGKTRLNWITISIVSINGNGFDPKKADGKPVRVLVTATGFMQNTEMTLTKLDGDKITYGNDSGKEPVLCEGIPFSLQFIKANRLRCFPLNESGNRRPELKTDSNRVQLSPEYKTIWYEIELF